MTSADEGKKVSFRVSGALGRRIQGLGHHSAEQYEGSETLRRGAFRVVEGVSSRCKEGM